MWDQPLCEISRTRCLIHLHRFRRQDVSHIHPKLPSNPYHLYSRSILFWHPGIYLIQHDRTSSSSRILFHSPSSTSYIPVGFTLSLYLSSQALYHYPYGVLPTVSCDRNCSVGDPARLEQNPSASGAKKKTSSKIKDKEMEDNEGVEGVVAKVCSREKRPSHLSG